MMNFKYVFRWHVPFLLLFLFTCRAMAADTLLILGDSLSAGYRMAANAAWPALLNEQWQAKTPVVNASISGDTSQQGLARLPALLKQHQPRWVLVELGGNDGLRGFPPQQTERTLRTIIKDIKAANAEPLLMQIHLPANYGRRYNEAFGAIYPARQRVRYSSPALFYGGGLSQAAMDAGRRHSSKSRRAAVYRRLDGEAAGSLS